MHEPIEAFAQQPRSHQQHHGRGQLNHHQVRTKATPQRPRCIAAALCESLAQVGERDAQQRRKRKQHARNGRNDKREPKHARIQSHSLQIGHARHPVGWNQTGQRLHRGECAANAEQTSTRRKYQSFGHELPHESGRRRAQCTAQGNLALAVLCAHQQQARHIHARNQQQQTRAAQ